MVFHVLLSSPAQGSVYTVNVGLRHDAGQAYRAHSFITKALTLPFQVTIQSKRKRLEGKKRPKECYMPEYSLLAQ